ncbi:Uncharacterized protein HZ326_27201 [Fusarium oxysporum f. sp. albedinis]|nr:Uncharacterized protein HZ326_27201 [Fusarium oxysporum f. sp. albedinis]
MARHFVNPLRQVIDTFNYLESVPIAPNPLSERIETLEGTQLGSTRWPPMQRPTVDETHHDQHSFHL